MGAGTGPGCSFPRGWGPPRCRGAPWGFGFPRSKGTRAGGFSSTYKGRKRIPAQAHGHGSHHAGSVSSDSKNAGAGGGSAAPLLVSPGWEQGLPSPRGPPRREGLLFDPAPQSCEPGAEFYGLLLKIGNGESIPWGSDPLRGTDGQWGPRDAARPPRCRDSDGRPARKAPP